ncbi:transcription factor bHLH95-like [Quillaja saponaria]|uniref:Transcription factor bHLH95-like n=1 Tax=Quillaja saponaria TaxID=32244 RepID=A0AAD7KU33_QUISA|nr:transcription factor bHLH95-like [Quillaja saponaria]
MSDGREGQHHELDGFLRGFSNLVNSGEGKEKTGTKPLDGGGTGTWTRCFNEHQIIKDGQVVGKVLGEAVKVDGNNYKRGKRNAGINGEHHQEKDGKVGESDHEIHIWTERERRKKMRNMFSSLHALLPQLPSKTDKSTIVDGAVNYIKTLEQTLHNLEKQKQERLQSAVTFAYEPIRAAITPRWIAYKDQSREAFLADQGSINTNNVVMTNGTTTTTIPRYPVGFQTFSYPNFVLNISGDDAQISVYSTKKPGLFSSICLVLEKNKIEVVTAHVFSVGNRSFYMIQVHANGGGGSDQFSEAFSVDEILKQAASEIMTWVIA